MGTRKFHGDMVGYSQIHWDKMRIYIVGCIQIYGSHTYG